MEQKIYFNGKETTQEFIDNYIKENGGAYNCKLGIEYNNGFINYFTPTNERIPLASLYEGGGPRSGAAPAGACGEQPP